ncbi:MAG: tyrosine-type recombinase/integrase [Elusimicrobiota bacterium]|nr:tyrosine-type recombinase/integrase [Elusimicrobiota bacterium]
MAKKVTAGKLEVDFTHDGRRYRGFVPVATLASLLTGSVPGEEAANLGKAGPMLFTRFVEDFYLPRNAKPNKKPSAYESDLCSVRALKTFFAGKFLHEITKGMREEFKQQRLTGVLSRNGEICSNNTVNRELSCLSQILEYGVQVDYVKENPLEGLKRLPVVHRSMFWLTKEKFDTAFLPAVMKHKHGAFRDLFEFATYTGGRLNEVLQAHKDDINWDRGELRLLTLKRRTTMKVYRYLSIKEIGPRLEDVLRRLKPHPETGYFFTKRNGEPCNSDHIDHVFGSVRNLAGLKENRFHDLRHTYAMHRAMTLVTFRQLQIELGHASPQSIQAYLDQAVRFEPKQSLFYRAVPAGGS